MSNKINFNSFADMPQIPYKIILYLVKNNQNIFKILKYDTADALSKPDLSIEEKMQMIYVDDTDDSEDHFGLFLKPLIGDELTKQCTQLRIFKVSMTPTDRVSAILNYEFDTICGSKMSLIYDEDGIPCSRIDIMEKEILSTLNGVDEFGIGYFQFSQDLSRYCTERLGISNSKTFFGSSLVLSCIQSSFEDEGCY